MVTVTFIRHGQSEDNVHDIWAGWKDAPLSALGRRQAQALGRSFASTTITRIYTSDLLRAHATAKAVHDHHAEPKPPFTPSELLREQHFGVAEGKEWAIDIPEGTTREELQKKGIYPVYWGRDEKFDGGESLDDLFRRSEEALKEFVFPYLDTDDHIAIASHGLCISELMSVLVKLDPKADQSESYRGLLNTAWTRVQLKRRVGGDSNNGAQPSLEISVSHVNHASHLAGLDGFTKDEDESKIRAFFGGETGSITNADTEVRPVCDK
ncbi:hypothetical protein H1R20_g11725, partial [Candolleomyces eurysporus]